MAGVYWKVTGSLDQTFCVALTLLGAGGQNVSTYYYDLLIGDQEIARLDCAKLAAESCAIREQFSSSDFNRFSPGLSDTNRFDRIGDALPAAYFSGTTGKQP